jgi:hypothetical protein
VFEFCVKVLPLSPNMSSSSFDKEHVDLVHILHHTNQSCKYNVHILHHTNQSSKYNVHILHHTNLTSSSIHPYKVNMLFVKWRGWHVRRQRQYFDTKFKHVYLEHWLVWCKMWTLYLQLWLVWCKMWTLYLELWLVWCKMWTLYLELGWYDVKCGHYI